MDLKNDEDRKNEDDLKNEEDLKKENDLKNEKDLKNDIEIEFELTLLTYKVFSCKDVRSKFLGVRLLAVQSNTQSRSWNGHPSNH